VQKIKELHKDHRLIDEE